MARREKVRNRVWETNRAVALVALGGLLVGIALFWVSNRSFLSDEWASIVNNVAGLVIATALLAMAWELLGKRSLTAELLAKTQLRTDVVAAGVERVTDQYLQDVEWDSLLDGAEKVDIVVAYASTWRNTHRASLEKIAKNKDARIRVFLPDPDDLRTMEALAARFSTDATALAGKVREAIDDFASLKQPAGGSVTIYVRPGDVVFSCYRLDAHAVLTLYSHSRERRSLVPTLVVGTGNLFSFVYEETKAILGQSRQIFP